MTQEQIRTVIYSNLNSAPSLSSEVLIYENRATPDYSPDTWVNFSLAFGEVTYSGLGQSKQVGVLYAQVFYRKDTGVSGKNVIVDKLGSLLDFKSLKDVNGLVQFRGHQEKPIGLVGEDYLQTNFSVGFQTIKGVI